MAKTAQENKQVIDEMGGKLFEYIANSCTPEEANKRCLELATSFLTCTIDMGQELEEIMDDISDALKEVTLMAFGGVTEYLTDPDDVNIITEVKFDD